MSKCIIPRVGDLWEFKLPNKPKKRKFIGAIYMKTYRKQDGTFTRHPFIDWERLPKGRYSGLRAKTLLTYGQRISSLAERNAEFEAFLAKRKAEKQQNNKYKD